MNSLTERKRYRESSIKIPKFFFTLPAKMPKVNLKESDGSADSLSISRITIKEQVLVSRPYVLLHKKMWIFVASVITDTTRNQFPIWKSE